MDVISLRQLAVACLVVAACSRRSREGACTSDRDCPSGRSCLRGSCAPRAPAAPTPIPVVPAPTTPTAPQPTPTEPGPTAQAGESDAALVQPPPGLAGGSLRCSFTEGGRDHDRQCVVTDTGNGGYRVVARGTGQNPTEDFTFDAFGAAPVYGVRGSLTASGDCGGAFTGALTREGTSEPPVYTVRWGRGCVITLRL
ncbi:MAG: hypothetical protein R3A48_29490 [Polyangiales bacterium]